MQWTRERLVLALIGLLPFHAFVVTVGTRLLRGPNLPPWSVLALWKEALLGVVLLLAVCELGALVLRRILRSADSKESGFVRAYNLFVIDGLDAAIFCLLLLSELVHPWSQPDALQMYITGFRYDFIALVSFVILRRVPWSAWFLHQLRLVLLISVSVVAGYGLLTMILPTSFFTWLGYSAAHSLYDPAGPIAAFQQIAESSVHRIQSVMSGPNQLGLWLLLPLAMLITGLARMDGEQSKNRSKHWGMWILTLVVLACLFGTFSRTAWIAMSAMVLVTVFGRVSKQWRKNILMIGVPVFCVLIIGAALLAPKVVFRLSSTRGHFEKPIEGLLLMQKHPWGLGIGSAGAASNRLKEPCIFLRPQDDPGWAQATPNLCVFLGKKQVQPVGHVCDCPVLTENWFVQIGVELGFAGMALWLMVTAIVLYRLYKGMGNRVSVVSHAMLLLWMGMATASLFLHAWEDSAISYSVWLILSALLPPKIPENS